MILKMEGLSWNMPFSHRRWICISWQYSSWSIPEILHKVIANGEDTDEQLYTCDEIVLYYSLFWNKSLDLEEVPSKANMKTNKEKVTLMLCVNKPGGHELKPLYISNVDGFSVSSAHTCHLYLWSTKTVPVFGWYMIFLPPGLKVSLCHQ